VATTLIIRKALIEEAPVLTRLAHDVSRVSGYPPHWMDFCKSDFEVSEDSVRNSSVFIAEEGGEVRGFYVVTANERQVDQLWVAPAYFGTGVGKELFLHAMNRRR